MEMINCILRISSNKVLSRSFCSSSTLQSKQWRLSKGLAANKTAESILTDGPDYTFLDGRPTPLLQKQKLRMLRQQEYASKIVQLTSELDFAKQRYQDNIKKEEDERESIINNRLKPKGKMLKQK